MWCGFALVMAALIVACISEYNARSEDRESPGHKIGGIIVCLAAAYALFLLVSVSFFDADTPLDSRLLAPLHVMVLIGVFARSGAIESSQERRPVVGFLANPPGHAGGGVHRRASDAGCSLDLRGAGQRHRVCVAGVGGFRSGPLRQATAAGCADLLQCRRRHRIADGTIRQTHPARSIRQPCSPRSTCGSSLRRWRADMAARGGYVFYFTGLWRHPSIPEAELQRELRLKLVYSGRDGRVYYRARSIQAKEKLSHRRTEKKRRATSRPSAAGRLAFWVWAS